ncbi:MAG: S8 family serine peptidase, partial [Actinomycetota bacterium]
MARFRSPVEGHVAARQNGWQVVDLLDSDGTVVLAVPEGQSPESFAPVLSRRSDVLTVEPDHQVRTLSQMADWGVVSVRAPEAHARNQATGKGVTIAIIDSGVDYLHEDLASNIWTNPGEVPDNGIDDDANGYVDDLHGWDFIGGEYTDVREDNDPMDFYGHGTHVAGIAAAADNDVGVLGVAPEATILPVRVVDDRGIGLDTTISQGIQYAAENGADIINMSLGIYALSSTVQRAVVRASERGATLVAAAGNEYYYSIPVYPAGYPSVISVAAGRRRALEKTWWSNWGNVDFVAPGEEVLSAFPQDAYASFFGSSQAAPHVAGALALIKQKHPSFGPVELEQALASTAQDLLFPTRDAVTGSGWIDAEAATGALPDPQFELYSDRYIIPSNGTTASTILARILDGAGAPLAGIRGTFTADRGTLSASEFTTDAAGTARTTLTVDDAHGLATVTASPAGTPARSIQVIVDDDRVRVNDVLIMGVPGGQVFAPPTSQAGLDPGDDLFFKIFLANHRFNVPQRAGATYTVTGPHGNPIPELSGSIEPVIVGVSFFGYWNSQVQARSVVHKIPPTALPGRYLLTVTASSVETGETDTYSTPFWVGESADVLVVRSFYYFDTETYNFFDPSMPRADPGVKAALDSLGRSFDFWDAAELGPPFARDVLSYSTVVWLGGWFPDLAIDALQPYLELGGNLLVSGELFGTWDRAAYSFFPPSTFHRDFLHGTGIFVVDYFDKNHQNYPVSVAGAPGELFEGLTFDINSYNLNSTGETTAIFTDELLV